MANEKIENLLNLALEATQEEREKALDLDVGYEPNTRTWEVIIKYSGTQEELLKAIQEQNPILWNRVLITNLINEYMILVMPEELVTAVASLPLVEYMEKPKRLVFAVNEGKRASCINPLQTAAGGGGEAFDGYHNLSGRNVIVAVIDSGIDIAHPDFCNPDGTTRILKLWDQTIPPGTVLNALGAEDEFLQAPLGYHIGTEFSEELINLALEQPTEQERYAICPSRDVSGHGTHVTGIAAGNGRASEGKYRGVAYESKLLVVKLGVQRENAFPKTTELMQAVDYCVKQAEGIPLVINLSFGNNYGSHEPYKKGKESRLVFVEFLPLS